MPKPRRTENRGLPSRWQLYHGAYYYRVPPGEEARWDGRKRFRLGATLAEAHKAYGERMGAATQPVRTTADLLTRYEREVVYAAENPLTRRDKLRTITRLRRVFGEAPIDLPNWPQMFYGYASSRTKTIKHADGTETKQPALTAAHRELEVLSHAFTKAVQWGLLPRHPTYEQVRFDGDLALKPRTRRVEDWEVVECLALPSRRRKGSVLMIQAYMRLKLLTGLARSDMLRLRVDEHITDDGIKVTRHKTRGTTGKTTLYEWTPERREAFERCKRVRPALSPFLFCDRTGAGYIDEETGECHGWDSMWSRFMDRVLSETQVKERFTEHDLRAKVGSDAESLERARALLQHADSRTTMRFYRRKEERV
jgi:integrase